MKTFINEKFMLKSKAAEKLYKKHAKDFPIIDYHCHLNPKEIAENKKFKNITEIWLGGDHYKWRLMRACGVDEKYITGNAGDKEKFLKWAETMSKCIGNPLYHWTHLELKRYFGIDKVLCPENAEKIWKKCNKILAGDKFTVHNILKKFNVKVVCTTDDPVDTLEYHKKIKAIKDLKTKVLPSFRPDKAINIDKSTFVEWIKKFGEVSGIDIRSTGDLKKALYDRIEYFHKIGCRVSDHAIETINFKNADENSISNSFQKAMKGEWLSQEEVDSYKTEILVFLGKVYAKFNWTMQLHFGVIRNLNTRMFEKLGPDTGYDAIGDFSIGSGLSLFLDALEKESLLPKTIIYTINSVHNEVISTIAGCFNKGIPGKIQFGTAWWFNDHKSGMEKQMTVLAETGVLANFVGMLTDSRSFLSYTRHEYFRRILCNLVGSWIENGELPEDLDGIGKIISGICYNNANNYFGF